MVLNMFEMRPVSILQEIQCSELLIRETNLIQHPVKCARENQHDTHTDGLNTLFE